MTRQQVFVVCFFILLLALLSQIVLIFRPFLVPMLWAVILARMTFPLYERLTKLLRGRERVAAGLLTLGIMLLGIVPIVYLALLLVDETGAAYDTVNAWVQTGGAKRVPEHLSKLPGGGLLQELIGRFVVTHGDVGGSLLQGTKAVSGFLFDQVTDLVKNVLQLAITFLVVIFTLFFFFKDGRSLYQGLYRLIPLEEAHKRKFFTRLDRTMSAVVQGMIITAIVQGLLAGVAYWVLGVPFPVLLTALTALLALLPFGGTALVWLPVAGYLFWVGPLWKVVVMLAWGAGVVTMVDNFLKPLLIGHGAQLPTLFLFFSILGGLAAYGFIGLFLGPILMAILMTAIQIYREEYQGDPASTPAKVE
jgi:predicted PurR-regulated permease PerM